MWNYSWIEQAFDPTTGGSVDANPARAGGYSGGLPDSPALEANNAGIDLTAPVLVFLKQKGVVNGQVYYEF